MLWKYYTDGIDSPIKTSDVIEINATYNGKAVHTGVLPMTACPSGLEAV